MNFQGDPLPSNGFKEKEKVMLEIKIDSLVMGRPMTINSRTVSEICDEVKMDIHSVLKGYQIHYAYRSSIVKLLLKDNIPFDRFIRREPFKLNEELEVKSIKQAGAQEITMVVLGLDFGVDDKVMFKYVESFRGQMVSNNVIYGKDKQGPFKGLLNGERKYLVNMDDVVCGMGTYHYLGDSKVKILYKGNSRTCGRCHEEPQRCPGKGLAQE